MENRIAKQFAEEWIKSWNSHDIDTIMSHYANEIEFHSPFIKMLNFNDTGIISSRAELKDYFKIGLLKYPDLHFNFHKYFVGINTICISYTSVNNKEALEVFELNNEGKATKVFCNYAIIEE
ncbi:nuclear transport factor 2 family protein [Flavobacterium sp. NG2]|uniref:nuclear transport factor 2 family protein n=1 Tax=Flavobacterium sp. NG2 TaxID=3097547 RepID=UPI002A8077E3|nr:nuclear transport factor 2 family protein [Flavobacterium sp. NG2]WPR70310.1 nuclear transport factor 2 family protein [Flavobacterium sp. NG2]